MLDGVRGGGVAHGMQRQGARQGRGPRTTEGAHGGAGEQRLQLRQRPASMEPMVSVATS